MSNRVFADYERMSAMQLDDDQRQIDRWINEGGGLLIEDEADRSKRNGRTGLPRESVQQLAVDRRSNPPGRQRPIKVIG